MALLLSGPLAASTGFVLPAAGTATASDGDPSLAANETATQTPSGSSPATATATATTTETPTASATTASPTPTATDTGTPTAARTSAERTTESGATTAPPATDPAFVVSNVSAPEAVRAGDEVAVTATVRNHANANRTERVNYSLAGRTVASERVTLAAGESKRVTFRTSVSSLDPATYVHGVRNASGAGVARRLRVSPDVDLTVAGLDAPTEISRGEPYVVLATVENPADSAITRTVSYAFDGVTVATKRVTVDAGSTGRVAFEFRIDDLETAAGPIANGSTHTHAVVTDGGARKGGEVVVRRGAGTDPSTLAVEQFRTGDDLRPGETIRVDLTVLNVGEAAFEGQVTYRVDESAVDTEWVRVPVGERRSVSFAVAHDALERRAVLETPGETSHGVWIGDVALKTRPVTVHGPFERSTETDAVTFTATPGASGSDGGANGGSAGTGRGGSCERGLLSPCGGTGLDETTLTVLGIVTSMIGIVYEMIQG